MLLFDGGEPFAIIKGGKYNGHYLGYDLNFKQNPKDIVHNPMDYLSKKGFFNDLKKEPEKNFEGLRKLIVGSGEKLNPNLKIIYEEAENAIKMQNGKEIILKDGELQIIPNPNAEREQLYISAPTGSGKSYFAAQYMQEWKNMFPDFAHKTLGAVIITPKLNDPIIEEFKLNAIDIYEKVEKEEPVVVTKEFEDGEIHEQEEEEEEPPKRKKRKKNIKTGEYALLKYPLNPSKVNHSCILFDDIDYIHDKEIKKEVETFLKDCQGTGRKDRVWVLLTSHIICKGWDTQLTIGEATWIVVFVNGGIGRGIDYFLRTYLRINDKELIKKIMELPSRWVAIHTRAPLMIAYQNGAFLI